jgi:hypothetical protein
MAQPFAGPLLITDASGAPVNNALVYTYDAGTFTPKAVFTTPALSVAHPNPIPAPNGKVTFYLGGGSYRIRVTDATGVDLPQYAQDDVSAAAGAGSSSESTAFAEESQTSTPGQTVFTLNSVSYVPGANSLRVFASGVRLYRGFDYTETNATTVTLTGGLATGQDFLFESGRFVSSGLDGTAVSFANSGANAVSRSVQGRLRDSVSVFDFLTAVQIADVQSGARALNVLPALQNAVNASYGKRLIFPKGNYRIEGTLNLIGSGIILEGEQFGNVSIVQHTDNTPHLKIGDGTLDNRVTRATVENFVFLPRSGAANWATAYAIEARYASFLDILHCEVYGQDGADYRIFGGIYFDRVSFSNIYDCWVRGVKGNGIFTVGAAGNLTADIRIANTYVLGFEGNAYHFSDYTNGHFIVNALAVGSVGQNGVYVDSDPANGGVNFFFTNLNMELSGTTCDGVTLNKGSLIQFQDGWWGAASGKSAVRVAAGVSNVTFSGPWTTEGRWLVEGTNVKVHGPGNIGTLVPASSAGLTIVGATASIVEVKDMTIAQFTGGGIATTSTPANVTLTGNDLTLLGGGTPIGGSFGTGSEIIGNRGDASRGVASSITVGSSPFTYTAGARPESVFITGGTVSAIAIGGVTVASATGHSVQLQPGKSVAVTYSSLPTMTKVLQ